MQTRFVSSVISAFVLCLIQWALPLVAHGQELDKALLKQRISTLVQNTRARGDAARGAILFHQPHLACNKCHSVTDSSEGKPGPELTKLGADVRPEHLIESILAPSKSIRKGFESTLIQLNLAVMISPIDNNITFNFPSGRNTQVVNILEFTTDPSKI